MGVAGLWNVLRPAGKLRSLTHLSVIDGFEANPDGQRGLRVGIDASIWFYHAAYGLKGENPELRTLFFRCTRLMEKPILPLFVFDGPRRPEMKRGKKISRENHWMVEGLQNIISAFGFEWRMAPGEAEAELAYLNRIGVIDAILSDDVDTFLFGARMVIRNPSTNLAGNRVQDMKNAAGRDDQNHVVTYAAADFLRDDIKLTQGGLVLIGIFSGGDYSDGLERCGLMTAYGLAKAGFGDTLLHAVRTLSRPALQEFLVRWRQDIRNELRTNTSGCLQRKSPALAREIPERFPDIDVLLAYVDPITSKGCDSEYKNTNVDWDKEPDLGRIAGLCEVYFEWGVREIIINRFRNVLWPSVVLRILRRAVLIKDRETVTFTASSPHTPRKNGKEPRTPPGTPSTMIRKHFAKSVLKPADSSDIHGDGAADGAAEEDGDEERLIVYIHSSRMHPSTDNVLEYRLEIAPAQLVRLCEGGIKGSRSSLLPHLSADDEDDAEVEDRDGGTAKKGKESKPPSSLSPHSHLRVWMPACMVELVEPGLVVEFQRKTAEKRAAKGGKG
ncbi:PIN domain-like protein, partial [Daedaleopsis nitida]